MNDDSVIVRGAGELPEKGIAHNDVIVRRQVELPDKGIAHNDVTVRGRGITSKRDIL